MLLFMCAGSLNGISSSDQVRESPPDLKNCLSVCPASRCQYKQPLAVHDGGHFGLADDDSLGKGK